MISDQETNVLFLADCLKEAQPDFYPRFIKTLEVCDITPKFLPKTNDIWAVDFMPIQVREEEFVQFKYDPDYLQAKELRKYISDGSKICKKLGIPIEKSEIVFDGGNVVRAKDTVIMCDKVFHENPKIPPKELIKKLRNLFEIDNLFFIPWDSENDFTGHADGMVRFIDEHTVFINELPTTGNEFEISLRTAIHNAGLDWVELPYIPPKDSMSNSAEGLYINYLQMKQAVIIPTFQTKEDEKAIRIFEETFKGQTIASVDSLELANEGGVLNCISWNIKQN